MTMKTHTISFTKIVIDPEDHGRSNSEKNFSLEKQKQKFQALKLDFLIEYVHYYNRKLQYKISIELLSILQSLSIIYSHVFYFTNNFIKRVSYEITICIRIKVHTHLLVHISSEKNNL